MVNSGSKVKYVFSAIDGCNWQVLIDWKLYHIDDMDM